MEWQPSALPPSPATSVAQLCALGTTACTVVPDADLMHVLAASAPSRDALATMHAAWYKALLAASAPITRIRHPALRAGAAAHLRAALTGCAKAKEEEGQENTLTMEEVEGRASATLATPALWGRAGATDMLASWMEAMQRVHTLCTPEHDARAALALEWRLTVTPLATLSDTVAGDWLAAAQRLDTTFATRAFTTAVTTARVKAEMKDGVKERV